MKKVAEFGTSQLASRLNTEEHFTLSYVEMEQKKVKIFVSLATAVLVFTIIKHKFHLRAGGTFGVL